MPVSHVGLTVSHLPTSCSFFLAALSPLGYRYQGQQDNQIGFGVDQADFFICQQSPGSPPGAAHIAFSAPSPAAVNSFFTSALKAGGRIHGEPAVRDPKTGYYSAAIIDLDGNSVEVVHRPEDQEYAGSKVSDCKYGSRVLTWQKDVAQSVVSYAPTAERSVARSVARSVTMPILTVTQPPVVLERKSSEDTASKTLIGSLMGAAAGAAIAYAISTSVQETSPGLSLQPALAGLYRAISAPPTPSQSPRSVVSTHSYHPRSPSYHAAPSSYHTSYQPRAIEAPGSATGSRSPPIVANSKCPTEVSRHSSQLHRPSLARSTHTAPVVVQLPSRPSLARSSASSSPKTVVQADYPPAASGHKAPKSTASRQKDDYRSTISRSRHGSYIGSPKEREEKGPVVEEVDDDAGTVAPSDSVSQVGGKRRHKHRRHRGEGENGEKGKSVVSLPVRGERERERSGSRRTVVF